MKIGVMGNKRSQLGTGNWIREIRRSWRSFHLSSSPNYFSPSLLPSHCVPCIYRASF